MIEVYLAFPGNAEEAANYYAKALEGEVTILMKISDMPKEAQDQMPPSEKDLVMHANVTTFAGQLMLGDDFEMDLPAPNARQYINISDKDIDRLRRVFNALAKDGEVLMPAEETFFSLYYGQVKDKYGYYWMVMSPDEPGAQ